jgi:hypothetical protein
MLECSKRVLDSRDPVPRDRAGLGGAVRSAQPRPFVCIPTPTAMPAPGAALIADFWLSTLSQDRVRP